MKRINIRRRLEATVSSREERSLAPKPKCSHQRQREAATSVQSLYEATTDSEYAGPARWALCFAEEISTRKCLGQLEWAEYIAEVGNGRTLVPGTQEMEVDADILVNSEDALIAFTFPQHLLDAPLAESSTSELLGSAILAPKLVSVARLNDRIREMLPGNDIVCASTDAPVFEDPLRRLDIDFAAQLVEHLNARNEEGTNRSHHIIITQIPHLRHATAPAHATSRNDPCAHAQLRPANGSLQWHKASAT